MPSLRHQLTLLVLSLSRHGRYSVDAAAATRRARRSLDQIQTLPDLSKAPELWVHAKAPYPVDKDPLELQTIGSAKFFSNCEGRFDGVSAMEMIAEDDKNSLFPVLPMTSTRKPALVSSFETEPTKCHLGVDLTQPFADQVGAVWSNIEFDVSEGFETTFRFSFLGPSTSCTDPNVRKSSKSCATRGGQGLALVLHGLRAADNTTRLDALGQGGNGLGYAGLENSVAVEFDSWFDDELGDPYDNHISVQTRGRHSPNSNNHNFALAVDASIPDMQDLQPHTVRVVYNPSLDSTTVHPSLCVTTGTCNKLQTRPNLGFLAAEGLVSSGLGSLSVFFDDLRTPVFMAPINLQTMLALLQNGTKAVMGFTAATSQDTWQVSSVMDWVQCGPGGSDCVSVLP